MKRLNDLSRKAWTKLSKSIWIKQSFKTQLTQLDLNIWPSTWVLLNNKRENNQMKPISINENYKTIVEFFSQKGGLVCDPFCCDEANGMATLTAQRQFYTAVSSEKIRKKVVSRLTHYSNDPNDHYVYTAKPMSLLKFIQARHVDLVATELPHYRDYFQDYVSEDDRPERLSITHYVEYLTILDEHFKACYRILKPNAYIVLITQDFVEAQRYYSPHADIINRLPEFGFVPQGLITLINDNKGLKPYGYPSTFVPNIVHKFAVIARKL